MSVNILHHGRCFDGAASSALFAAFYRQCIREKQPFRFLPKRHRQGDPFESSDFDCEWAACVDFRYSQHPKLHWYFDHHRSAFQLPGDEAHFLADTTGRKFHDAQALSCAGYIAKISHERFGFDASQYTELIAWANTIDSANFPDPSSAVRMESSGMQLAAYIQSVDSEDAATRFIEDLLVTPLAELSTAEYIQQIVGPRMEQHREDIEAVGRAASVRNGTIAYDLIESGPRVISHFIPYHHHPSANYAVGAYHHVDGDLRLTVGYNPWLSPRDRVHDLARLCEKYGGGGHPFVAGCSFDIDDLDALRRAYVEIISTLSTATVRPDAP